jgi:hypothetical protein
MFSGDWTREIINETSRQDHVGGHDHRRIEERSGLAICVDV